MKRPVIFTGAAGFIGRDVVAARTARGAIDLVLVGAMGRTLSSTICFASRPQPVFPQDGSTRTRA